VHIGDIFKSKKYPNLKQIIQISHKTIPGTEKFKVILDILIKFIALSSLYFFNDDK
jgi:hypothetical protein